MIETFATLRAVINVANLIAPYQILKCIISYMR